MSGLVLGSSSPRRLGLLSQVGLVPDVIFSPDIDESVKRGEVVESLCRRLSRMKYDVTRSSSCCPSDYYVLCADTVVSVGGRILPKAESESEALDCLKLLSGRSHRVCTCVVVGCPDGSVVDRVVVTRVRFGRLGSDDISRYISSGEWMGKAGGYGIQGYAGSFVVRLIGSYTNVVGLPLYETLSLLRGCGFSWSPNFASEK